MNLLTILLQEAPAGKGGMGLGLLPMLLIIVVFVIFIILPQSTRTKDQRQFRENLKKGDKVVTIGGFHGKITEVKENTVMVSIAPDVVVELEKTALVQSPAQVGGQS